MTSFYYTLLTSEFGTLSIVWKNEKEPRAYRIFLPSEKILMKDRIRIMFKNAVPRSCPRIVRLGGKIQLFLAGEDVKFSLDIAALDACSLFQRRVLLTEYKIPRGWVSTYGRLAKTLGIKSARAVGRALSENPFPLLIPCHRVIRNDSNLGGYQGGLAMKKTLLEYEGIIVSREGRVLTDRVYY